ncbi:MAG TPA: SMI1/KNR4 family protein [Verrucomicrobiae bacterium]|jgi:cell wall assembly regulator SMI1|nr:SMI1/KNR4 family protein [Verrucomicrobiae bacterium]
MSRWQKIGIGAALALAILIAVVFSARTTLNNFFYPAAPPMPAVVSESMPQILARLESILKTNAPQVLAGLQPGLAATDVSKLEQQYNIQLPPELEALYEWHDGARSTTNYVGNDFIPIHRFQPLAEALEENTTISTGPATAVQRAAYQIFAGHRDSWICLLSDGAGDGYWFDPKRKATEGAVFYNFNEDGDYIFFPSAKNLLAGIAKCYEQGIYRVKAGSSPPQLDEDFERSAKLWPEFGAGNRGD